MFPIHTEEPIAQEVPLVEVLREVKAAEVIDKLRTRGAPIDMIDSYLFAGELDSANIAFRSTVLEGVYEHLQTSHCKVQFSTRLNPPIHVPNNVQLDIDFIFDHCVEKATYDLTDQNVRPAVYQVSTTQELRDVSDTLRATILQQIANTITNLLERIYKTVGTREANIRLFPGWSTSQLTVQPKDTLPVTAVGSRVTLGISAYQLKKK